MMASEESITVEEARSRGYDRTAIARIELEEKAKADAVVLIHLITEAFDGVSRPRITLRVARGYDDEWNLTDERVAELRNYDPEERWLDVSDDVIEAYQEYFNFSDAEGWLFYLPAFMCHYLRNAPDCGWDAVCSACDMQIHIELLNKAQLDCLQRFRDFCDKYKDNY